MDDGLTESAALGQLREAGIIWAASGHGQPFVDAAALALAAGIDSPRLRVLAGALSRFADEETSELAPGVFEELNLGVPEKFSAEAYIAVARLRARDFLRGDLSARQLANELWRFYASCDYSPALAAASALGDCYSLFDDGVIPGDEAAVDAQVRECAEELVAGGELTRRSYWDQHKQSD